jgi:uncharacterized protein YkwD
MLNRYRALVAALVGLWVTALAWSEPVQKDGSRTSAKKTPDLARVTKAIIEKTNAFRQKQGRKKVTVNPKLTETARYFAKFMARTGKYGHEADGNQPADRAKKFGYDYCLVAENIAYQYDSAGFTTQRLGTRFFEGWQNSPPHRKNMLDPDVSETAVAVAPSKKTGYSYAVQLFGRPKSQAISFQVANESDTTVEYRLGDQKYKLPPRYTRTHEICRPESMTFEMPGGKERTVRPGNGDRIMITPDGGKVQVERS